MALRITIVEKLIPGRTYILVRCNACCHEHLVRVDSLSCHVARRLKQNMQVGLVCPKCAHPYHTSHSLAEKLPTPVERKWWRLG